MDTLLKSYVDTMMQYSGEMAILKRQPRKNASLIRLLQEGIDLQQRGFEARLSDLLYRAEVKGEETIYKMFKVV